MSEYKRTWSDEMVDEKTGCKRWNLLLDGKAVPGAFIIEEDEGKYRSYYPHLGSMTLAIQDGLDKAKAAMERIPPVKHDGIEVGRTMTAVDEGDSLLTNEEAGALLGISKYRINAMVANGVLPATRRDGQVYVSRKAVETRKSGTVVKGPSGKFANRYIRYMSNDVETEFTIVEVHHDMADDMAAAEAFVKAMSSDEICGSALWMSYSDAHTLCEYARKALDDGINHNSSIRPVPFAEFAPEIEACLARRKTECQEQVDETYPTENEAPVAV